MPVALAISVDVVQWPYTDGVDIWPRALGTQVYDHIVVSGNKVFSFREFGLL
ncbi:MAG: hypothetical protein P1P76_09800 [Anaerolineales bacterium]|nr:hypothetical protein [Anaerolineales bacterium]